MADDAPVKAEGRSNNNTAVLNTVNEAKFSWFHVKAILISGVG